jgi:hypothetical protein
LGEIWLVEIGDALMNGIVELGKLLKSIEPKKHDAKYVYCTIDDEIPSIVIDSFLLLFKEEEGFTVVLEKEKADTMSLQYDDVWELVTLTVQSSLSAVGFIAAVTQHLADNGISTNVISAYFHDHLLVPIGRSDEVVKLLNELQNSSI